LDALQGLPSPEGHIVLLSHKDFVVRAKAAAALSLFPKSPKHFRAVAGLVDSDSFQIRETAAQALVSVSQRGDQLAVEALGRLLTDKVREVRQAAAAGLRRVALPGDPSAISVAMACVTQGEWPVQCSALRVLMDLAPGDRALLTDVAEQLKTDSSATLAKNSADRLLQDMVESMKAEESVGTSTSSDEQHDEHGYGSDCGGLWNSSQRPHWGSEASDAELEWEES